MSSGKDGSSFVGSPHYTATPGGNPKRFARRKHPRDCSCAVPCRSCGHSSEQHAGNMWHGTGSRPCRVDGCKCRGCYIGSTPARCKQVPS